MDDVIPSHLSTPAPALPAPAPPAAKTPSIPARAARKLRPFLMLAVVLLVALAAGGVYVAMHAGKESTDDAQVEADVVALAPRVSGRIAKVLVRDNQKVNAGDEVLVLEDDDVRARVAKAERQPIAQKSTYSLSCAKSSR